MAMIDKTLAPSGKERGEAGGALRSRLADLARKHDFSVDAVEAMWQAVLRGGGTMAQFHHAEFGGHGQWMRNGMVMVGDMFNQTLAGRVSRLCDELVRLRDEFPTAAQSQRLGGSDERWWPAGLRSPATSGAQNDYRYAWFPQDRRLVIERNGSVEVYDTADHVISGVAQQQGGSRSLCFSSQHGPIALSSLRRVDAQATTAGASPSTDRHAAPELAASIGGASPRCGRGEATHDQLLDTLSRLAELHERGVLTDEEFKGKKADLLSRI